MELADFVTPVDNSSRTLDLCERLDNGCVPPPRFHDRRPAIIISYVASMRREASRVVASVRGTESSPKERTTNFSALCVWPLLQQHLQEPYIRQWQKPFGSSLVHQVFLIGFCCTLLRGRGYPEEYS